jgi:uncharacterized protein YdeI (YjbR/CyaY-like superfamily)
MKPIFLKTQADLRDWFEKYHAHRAELVIGFFKTGSGKQGITYKQALDEALCFGWIDGIRKTIDDRRWMIRWTPRRPRSIWSAVNLKRAAELEAEGRMRPAGLAAFHGHDTRRTKQYSFENKDRKLDPAQEREFRANKNAWEWFSKQAPHYQRTASFWVVSAKQEATRARRLATLIHDSEQGVRVSALRRPEPK